MAMRNEMACWEATAIKDAVACRSGALSKEGICNAGGKRPNGGRSRPLGNAASSIVANTPRGQPSTISWPASSLGPCSTGDVRGGATRMGNSTTPGTEAQQACTRGPGVMKDSDVTVRDGGSASKQWAAPSTPSRPAEERKGSPQACDLLESRHASVGSGSHSDSDESHTSSMSLRDLKKSIRDGRRSDIKGESKVVRLSFADCFVEAEKEQTSGRWKQSLMTDFRQLCAAGSLRESILQGLEMYGYSAPNKLQQYLIPVFFYFLGKHLEGRLDEKGPVRSCLTVQGPQCGKTASAILTALSILDPSVPRPQAILVSRSSKLEISKYMRVFALAHSFSYQAFEQDETGLDLEIDPASPEAIAARKAHILVGHPGRLRKVLSSGASIPIDAVKVFVVDDAHELFHGSSNEAEVTPVQSQPQLCLTGLPSGEKRMDVGEELHGGENPSSPSAASSASAIDDVVEICKLLESADATKIPYIVLAEEISDKANKKMIKLLKNSMVTKKNLFSVESCPLPSKLIKAMKHYYAEAARTEWVRIFAGLVQALTFPRALVYCDDERIHQYLREMQGMGIAVSANLPGATSEARKNALQDFSSNKTQFLLTHSEPAVCQTMLPKVSCVFHFGILSQLPSVYGVRLCPLDERLKKESASILLVEAEKVPKACDLHPLVAKMQKSFNISFMDMPLEMLPTRPVRRS